MIYLLEDDDSIRKLVVYTLSSQNFEAKGFEHPSDFWVAVDSTAPELILLDIMLPEEDGLTVLRKLRARPALKKIPVILMTARDTEYDKVVGLDAGADDYLAKPFGMMELVARVRAVLRRCENAPAQTEYRVGSLCVSPARHVVRVDGMDVTLTPKEFELLCILIENEGIVLTRDTLLDRVWGYEFNGESRTVDVHVRTLRQKLGAAGNCIETVRGVGYKLEAGV